MDTTPAPSLLELAETLHDHLNRKVRYDPAFLPRPFFIEFTGSPSSGKTTLIKKIGEGFERCGFRVFTPVEGAEAIRHISRETPRYNIRTGLYALTQLMDLGHGHLYDVVIFDRCVFDAYCWMIYWRSKELLEDEEIKVLQSFFLSRFWMDMIDVAYITICDPEVAWQREMETALIAKAGNTGTLEQLALFRDQYFRAYEELNPQFPQLRLLDTTHLSRQELIDTVGHEIFETLAKKVTTLIAK